MTENSNGRQENPVRDKSLAFAIRIVHTHRFLVHQKNEYILAKQLLKSGTSIGANIAEAQSAISRADFSNKISISFKEARETIYWLQLLSATGFLTKDEFQSLNSDCEELCKLLFTILKTTRIKPRSAIT